MDIQRRHVNGKGEMYINSGRENQGIVGRTDIKARIFPAHTITVDMFGYAWYRDFVYKMATHAHVFSLETKEKYSENALLYLAAAMFHLKNKYSYSNMCNWTKMCQEKLYLPVTSSGSPDHKFMEIKIRAVMKITVKHLVQWKDTELEALKQAVSE